MGGLGQNNRGGPQGSEDWRNTLGDGFEPVGGHAGQDGQQGMRPLYHRSNGHRIKSIKTSLPPPSAFVDPNKLSGCISSLQKRALVGH